MAQNLVIIFNLIHNVKQVYISRYTLYTYLCFTLIESCENKSLFIPILFISKNEINVQTFIIQTLNYFASYSIAN